MRETVTVKVILCICLKMNGLFCCLGTRGIPPRGGNSHVRGGGGGGGRGFGRNSEQQSSHEQATHA